MLGEEACLTDGSVPGLNAPADKRWAISARLDQDNTAKRAAKLSRSNVFMDAGSEGLSRRTARAGVGDGVLFFEPDCWKALTEQWQYVFTGREPTARGDLETIRNVFDSNGDIKNTPCGSSLASPSGVGVGNSKTLRCAHGGREARLQLG